MFTPDMPYPVVIEDGELKRFPVFERAVNFTKAVASHAVAGFPVLAAEETEARLAICRDCPQYSANRCSLCGCNLRLKASWAEQKCPLGRWPDLDLTAKEKFVS